MKIFLSITTIILVVVLGIFILKPDFSNSVISKKESSLPTISIYPAVIYPGDPVFITINSSSTPTVVLFDKKPLKTFQYDGKSHAVVPIDFSTKVFKHTIAATLSNKMIATTSITITPREKIEKPLGIPAKLGGNTPEASKALVKNLAAENFTLNSIKTASTTLWTENFSYPLSYIFVTDNYGYDRKTVGQTIVHKGTDFRALTGIEVMVMNSGVVEIATKYTVYGNTVVVDHGSGIHTMYMHLPKINVKKGERVKKGDILGLSGETGYAGAPHLHISVRVNGISIDPLTFLKFFTLE